MYPMFVQQAYLVLKVGPNKLVCASFLIQNGLPEIDSRT